MRTSLAIFLLFPCGAFAANDCHQALVEKVHGSLKRLPEQAAQDPKFEEGDLFGTGDSFRTGPKSWADLRLCDGTLVRVGSDTEVEFEDETKDNWDFIVTKGALRVAVGGTGKEHGPRVRFRSPTGSVGGRSGEFLLEVASEAPRNTAVHVLKGEALLGPDEAWAELHGLAPGSVPDRFTLVPAGKFSAVGNDNEVSAPEKFERPKLLREHSKGAAAQLFLNGVRATGPKETSAIYARAEAKRRKNLTPEQREKLEKLEKQGKPAE